MIKSEWNLTLALTYRWVKLGTVRELNRFRIQFRSFARCLTILYNLHNPYHTQWDSLCVVEFGAGKIQFTWYGIETGALWVRPACPTPVGAGGERCRYLPGGDKAACHVKRVYHNIEGDIFSEIWRRMPRCGFGVRRGRDSQGQDLLIPTPSSPQQHPHSLQDQTETWSGQDTADRRVLDIETWNKSYPVCELPRGLW